MEHPTEKQFKAKLQAREIQPSGNSWEKLDRQLEKGERRRRYFAVQSAAAAAVLAGILYFGDFSIPVIPSSPGMVVTPVEEISGAEEGSKIQEQKTVSTKQDEILKSKISTAAIVAVEIKTTSPTPDPEPETVSEFSVGEKMVSASFGDSFKVNEISAATIESSIADAEVDALLKKATEELNLQNSSGAAALGALELLREVEMEMDRSFREKVFDLLKEGYLKTKTAVANRNN